FDPTTFGPGAFGSNEAPMEVPVYSLNHVPYLPSDQSFTVQVSAEGLQPGQTVSGFQLVMFLDGGQQLAKVEHPDGSCPSNYGYSEQFTLEANDRGQATKTFTMQINKNVDGAAKIRLRQGKTNLVTNSVTVGKSEQIEEPIEPITIQDARATSSP